MYLLDTNVCIDYLNGRYPQVIRRLTALTPDQVAVSVVAVAELRYGAEKSARAAENHLRLNQLLLELEVLSFDLAATKTYGHLRAELERQGTPIGPNDMLIAAQALAHNLVLVTDNLAELSRVPYLQVENWRTVPS